MSQTTATPEYVSDHSDHSASLFLLLLLAADLAFIVMHAIHALTPFLSHALFSLEGDGAYAEMFQYLKWFGTIILLACISKSRQSVSYVAWALVFTYLLCDDALSIHERGGSYIAGHLDLTPPFGLRLRDLGELAVSATAGMILLPLVLWTYFRGSQAFRKLSHDLLLLILALVFFGVLVDMAHVAIQLGWKVDFLLGTLEDGGEMLVASLILWYVALAIARDQRAALYLCGFFRAALTRRPT